MEKRGQNKYPGFSSFLPSSLFLVSPSGDSYLGASWQKSPEKMADESSAYRETRIQQRRVENGSGRELVENNQRTYNGEVLGTMIPSSSNA